MHGNDSHRTTGRPPSRTAGAGEAPGAAAPVGLAARAGRPRDFRAALALLLSDGVGVARLGGAGAVALLGPQPGAAGGRLSVRFPERPGVLLPDPALDDGRRRPHVRDRGDAGGLLRGLLPRR